MLLTEQQISSGVSDGRHFFKKKESMNRIGDHQSKHYKADIDD